LLSLDEESVRWFVHGRLAVSFDDRMVVRDGVAVGHGTLKNWEGEAVSAGRANEVIDFAAAEAVTDALKRAAVGLGESLGLCLYPLVGGEKAPKKDHRGASDASGSATKTKGPKRAKKF
jgi:hypothetical protein